MSLEITQPTNREFAFLMAALMSIVAISIDAFLPALGIVARDLRFTDANQAQYLIAVIFLGMSVGELIAGPLSDAWGRKPVLYIGIVLFLVGSVLCFAAQNFTTIVIGRILQGLGVAGPYVSAVSIVRDKYSGRHMARIMSIVMMIFIMVPAIAPTLGQGILFFASWRSIFILYILYATFIAGWLFFRLEETLPAAQRIPLTFKNLRNGITEITSNRITVCYTICTGLCFGSFMGYLNASQQIFQDQFHTGKLFTVYFGGLALLLGFASLLNAGFVERKGMRYICVRAFWAIIIASLVFLGVCRFVDITLWMFVIYAAILFFSFGLLFGNLNALAMEPMGHIAGIAAAVTGAVSSLLATILGTFISQAYNGTLVPLALGFLILSLLGLLVLRLAGQDTAYHHLDEDDGQTLALN